MNPMKAFSGMPPSGADFAQIAGALSERRGNSRFPIQQDVHYRILGARSDPASGIGQTLNISSSGILFRTESPLTPGKHLEVSINWPAQLDGKCPLKLVARGWVKRCRGSQVAVEIEKYEFRTRRIAAQPAA
jgi:hypothetical protein